jgi:hypothetical protein
VAEEEPKRLALSSFVISFPAEHIQHSQSSRMPT